MITDIGSVFRFHLSIMTVNVDVGHERICPVTLAGVFKGKNDIGLRPCS